MAVPNYRQPVDLSPSPIVAPTPEQLLATGTALAALPFILLNNGVARTQLERFLDRISVKEFGAKGDGVTNDTAAVLLAMQHCETNQLMLYWPAGSYKLSTWTTRLSSFVAMCGDGPFLTKIVGPKAVGTHFVQMTTGGFIDLEGIGFTAFDQCLYSEAALDSVRFDRCRGYRLRSNLYRQADVTDYPASAVGRVTLTDNLIELSGGFQVHGTVTQGVAMGNVLKNVKRDASYWTGDTALWQTFGISFGDTDNNAASVAQGLTGDITIIGNSITGMWNDAPQGQFNTTNAIQVSAVNAVISSNVVSGMDATDLTNNEAIYCKARNYTIASNAVKNSKTNSTCIAIKGTLNISGPMQKNSQIFANAISSDNGNCLNAITLFAGGWVDISNNTVDGMNTDAIRILGDPYRVNVVDNALSASGGVNAIRFDVGSIENCRIEGNTLDGILATTGDLRPIKITANPKQLSTITVTAGGSGYPNSGSLTISGGGGTATGQYTAVSGVIISAVVNGSDANFTSAPTITANGGGSGATFTGVLSTGKINDVSIRRNRIKWSPRSTLTTATAIYLQSDAGGSRASGGLIIEDNDIYADANANSSAIVGVNLYSATSQWCRDVKVRGLNMWGPDITALRPVTFNSTVNLYTQSANYTALSVDDVTINGIRRRILSGAQVNDTRTTLVIGLAGKAVGSTQVGEIQQGVIVTRAMIFVNGAPTSGTSAGKIAFSIGTAGTKGILADTLVTAFTATQSYACIPDGSAANAKRSYASSGKVPIYLDVSVEALTGGILTLILETEAIAV